jgi:hypothetical protein
MHSFMSGKQLAYTLQIGPSTACYWTEACVFFHFVQEGPNFPAAIYLLAAALRFASPWGQDWGNEAKKQIGHYNFVY